MPDRSAPLRTDIADILRARSGQQIEDVAEEVYSAIEKQVDANVVAYEETVISRCARTHSRKGPAPCASCQQRITIAKTIRTVVLPPAGE